MRSGSAPAIAAAAAWHSAADPPQVAQPLEGGLHVLPLEPVQVDRAYRITLFVDGAKVRQRRPGLQL